MTDADDGVTDDVHDKATDDGDDKTTDEQVAEVEETPKKLSKKRKSKERMRADLAAAADTTRKLKRVVVGVGAAAVILAGGTIGFAVANQSARSQLSQEHDTAAHQSSELEGARKAAVDYTTRALTIDFQKSTEFVKGLATGTTEAFGKTFSLEPNGAGALTKELIDQLRMVSEGEIVYAFLDGDPAADRKAGEPWNFVIAARQTSTTVQQPERTTTAVILRVSVVNVNGAWKVANFAPDPKVQGSDAGLIPGTK